MNPVFWFELPARDNKKLASFYEKAFGWKPNVVPAGDGNDYVVVHTSETDKDGMPKEGNRINGGIYKLTKENEECAGTPNVVLATSDIQKSAKDIEAAGGKMLAEPYEIPGYGMYAPFLDPEGNRGAVMQPKMP